jgi:hypothetical protein
MFADVVVEDRDERPFMLVDVKASVASLEVLQEFIDQLDQLDASFFLECSSILRTFIS